MQNTACSANLHQFPISTSHMRKDTRVPWLFHTACDQKTGRGLGTSLVWKLDGRYWIVWNQAYSITALFASNSWTFLTRATLVLRSHTLFYIHRSLLQLQMAFTEGQVSSFFSQSRQPKPQIQIQLSNTDQKFTELWPIIVSHHSNDTTTSIGNYMAWINCEATAGIKIKLHVDEIPHCAEPCWAEISTS